jgi:hypothetical protein
MLTSFPWRLLGQDMGHFPHAHDSHAWCVDRKLLEGPKDVRHGMEHMLQELSEHIEDVIENRWVQSTVSSTLGTRSMMCHTQLGGRLVSCACDRKYLSVQCRLTPRRACACLAVKAAVPTSHMGDFVPYVCHGIPASFLSSFNGSKCKPFTLFNTNG